MTIEERRKVNEHYITSINEEGRNLTDWEKSFMYDVSDWFDRGGNLSEKQEEIVKRIYDEKT